MAGAERVIVQNIPRSQRRTLDDFIVDPFVEYPLVDAYLAKLVLDHRDLLSMCGLRETTPQIMRIARW